MKRILQFLLILLLLIGVEYAVSNYTVGTTDYTVKLDHLPNSFQGFKILQLTDLHSKQFPFHNAQLMKQIRKAKPDIIVMTGDMVNTSDKDFDAFINLSQKLARQYPVYYIIGNHEQALSKSTLSLLKAKLADAGVFVLDNRKVKLTRGNDFINLYGLWFHLRFYRDVNDEQTKEYIVGDEQMKKILGRVSDKEVNILLAHNPVYFHAYARWGADLTLAGHMHGGMIRIPFYGGVLSPEKEYFPEFDAGIFEDLDKKMIVSRGLGEYAGFRFINQPELVLIQLLQ